MARARAGLSARFSCACKIRYGVASIRRQRSRLVAPLDLLCRGCAFRARIHCGFHRRVTESETSGTRLAHHYAVCRFLSGISICGIFGLAFGWRWLVRAPGNSDGHWIDGSVFPADFCGPSGTPPQKLDLVSFCLHSRLDGGRVRHIPLVKGVLATFCRMVSDISIVWTVLARSSWSWARWRWR